MSEQAKFEASAREIADACVRTHQSALQEAGLRTDVQITPWNGESLQGSEIRLVFWRGTRMIDVIEDFIIKDGRPTGSRDELQRWLEEGIEAVLKGVEPGL
jgi:hypothetical protein